VHDGRLTRFTATVISDRPGGLAELLTRVIADCGASIQDIVHERAFSGPDVFAVNAVCTVENRDHAHLAALRAALRKNGFALR
jgi:threonine dehydratase